MRNTLIARTIFVIGRDGLDKTTTKAITAGTGINEAYIYRHFSDKEDLLAQAFDSLDEDFISKTLKEFSIMTASEVDFETRCRRYFFVIWQFLNECREECLAYMRYYYSPYFSKNSAEKHRIRFLPLVDKFKDAFKEEADVWMILNHILHVMLAFSVMVHNEQMPMDDDYSEHVFRVIYASVKQYFKTEEEKS